VDGVLLDLGVSSPQLDEAARGFSFLREGPLDMRMDRTGGVSAAELVNCESAENLERIFREWGEEPQARRVARAIAKARESKRLETTVELAALVERTLGRHGAHHPATRVFQALRMAVNDEIGELERALEGALEVLKAGGRFAVITFESLTDRIVKRFFAAHVGRMVSLQQGGARWEGVLPRVKAVTRKAVTAGAEELDFNPRSRSAKLRAIEKELD
jgi:16S rRNA (cytosine1402-N4)-methyltransferase